MIRRRFVFSAVALLTCGVFGASAPAQDSQPAAAAPPSTQPAAEAAEQGDAVVRNMALTLIEPGAAPRTELRLRPEIGRTEQLVVLSRMSMQQTMGAMQMPSQKIPATKITSRITPTMVSDDGMITYDFEYAEVEVIEEEGVNPMIFGMMQQAVGQLKGSNGTITLDQRGAVQDVTMNAPAGANPMAGQQLEGFKQSFVQMAVPLPAEAVGVGGKWSVQYDLGVGNIKVTQSAHYTVKSIEDGVVTFETALTQTADPQKIDSGMPGADVMLTSLKGDGSGTVVVNMSRIAPVDASLAFKQQTSMDMVMQGMEQKLDQTIDTQTTMTGTLAAATAAAPGSE